MRRRHVAFIVALALAALALSSAAGAQEPPFRAGLVIQNGDGEVQTACVRFAEPEISGLDLLERSGVPVVAQISGVGAAICKIGPEGCDYPAEGCFCERDGPRAIYWAYYLREGDEWRYSNQSAGSVLVRDGDVQGWAWGLGDSGSGAVPPLLDIDAICPVPAAVEPSAAASAAAAAPPERASPVNPAATTAPGADPGSATPPAPTSTAVAPEPRAPAEGGWSGYLGFAVIAAALIGGGAIAARRRR